VGRTALGAARQCLQVYRGLLELNRPRQAFSSFRELHIFYVQSLWFIEPEATGLHAVDHE
jgi:hypothetical protein